MPSVIISTDDVKKALDLLILQKKKEAKKLASGIRKIVKSRTRINSHIRFPSDMYRKFNELVPKSS